MTFFFCENSATLHSSGCLPALVVGSSGATDDDHHHGDKNASIDLVFSLGLFVLDLNFAISGRAVTFRLPLRRLHRIKSSERVAGLVWVHLSGCFRVNLTEFALNCFKWSLAHLKWPKLFD